MLARMALFAAIASGLFAQGPAFEVASVKPSAGRRVRGRRPFRVDAGRVDISSLSLESLITRAYGVESYQIAGPEWLSDARFDIAATIPEGVGKDQIPGMLRSLLEERFKLAVHHETRPLPVYALGVAKGGPKLKEAELSADPAKNKSHSSFRSGHDGTGVLQLSNASMSDFVDMVDGFVDRPIFDETGLKGSYDVELEFDLRRNAQPTGSPNVPTASDPGSSILSAVLKLGLRLEPRKEPVDMIVVDHAEKTPTEN